MTKRIGILGPGSIACKMATTINMMAERGDDVSLYAVASRDEQKATEFARRFQVEKAYFGYEQMLRDPNIDLVYVSTPHALHAGQMLECIRSGKPVLCEKSFTGNARQAEEVLELSEKLGVLTAEAIWTRYMPSRRLIDEVIASGELGQIQTVTANLGYDIDQVPRIRLPELAGGALLDLGVYTLNFAAMVLGKDVVKTQSIATMFDTGVDQEEIVVQHYANGATAYLTNTAAARTDRRGIVYGDKARLECDNVNNPLHFAIYDTEDRLVRAFDAPAQLTGFEDQVNACLRALDAKQIECPEMPHAEILRIMRQMDELRTQWGMRYPFD